MRVVMSAQVKEYGESQDATRYRLQLALDHAPSDMIWTRLIIAVLTTERARLGTSKANAAPVKIEQNRMIFARDVHGVYV
jgi:hypothetical protein